MTTRVAVIVLNWNGWRDTIACVESLRRQTVKPEWIVVVDNASTDESPQRLRALGDDVTFIESGGNFGFAGGNNVGVRWALKAGADAVWLLNNDATAEARALEELLATSARHHRAGLIGTRIYEMQRPSVMQCWGGGWINVWTGRAREYDHEVRLAELDYITGCSMFIPRWALEQGGMLDEGFFMYFEDAELSLRYRALGMELAVADGARVLHRGGASAKPGRAQQSWRTQSLLRILRAHAPSFVASTVVSTALRGTSMVLHGHLDQAGALASDLLRFVVRPDWRRDEKT